MKVELKRPWYFRSVLYDTESLHTFPEDFRKHLPSRAVILEEPELVTPKEPELVTPKEPELATPKEPVAVDKPKTKG